RWRFPVRRAAEVPARRGASPGPDGESPSQRGGLAHAPLIDPRGRSAGAPLRSPSWLPDMRAAFGRPSVFSGTDRQGRRRRTSAPFQLGTHASPAISVTTNGPGPTGNLRATRFVAGST